MIRNAISSFVLSTLLILSLSAPSQAAVFDFVTLAAGNEGTLANGTSFMNGGVTVTLSAANLVGGNPVPGPLPYLDDLFPPVTGGPGGLGVCQAPTTANLDCSDPSDDNITENEIITLTFDQPVTLNPITFSNGIHEQTFNGNFGVVIDQMPTLANFQMMSNQFLTQSPFTTPLSGTTFHFVSNSTFSGTSPDDNIQNPRELYLNIVTATPVPIPGAALLFGSGLIGLIGIARRKGIIPNK